MMSSAQDGRYNEIKILLESALRFDAGICILRVRRNDQGIFKSCNKQL
jgi:hypothetical protein